MRFTVAPEQHKFFQLKGYLELENLLSAQEAIDLIAAINQIQEQSPGYPTLNLFRSIPLIASLAKKKGWGQIATELIHKKPLKIAYDAYFTSWPDAQDPLESDSCGLVIDLNARTGLFFQDFLLAATLYKSSKSCYFLLIMTAKHLPDQINPMIVK